MLRSAIDVLGAALASQTETALPAQKNKAAQYAVLSAFLQPFGAALTLSSDETGVTVLPVQVLPKNNAFGLSCPDEELFWLLCGAAARMDLICLFRDVPSAVTQAQLLTVTRASKGTVQFLRKENAVALSSMLGAGEVDVSPGLPTPFVAGLILGSVLCKRGVVAKPGTQYLSSAEVRRAVAALCAAGCSVRRPMPGVLVLPSRRGQDFDLVTGALLFTEEEKAENRKKRLTCAEAKKKALSGRLHSEAERVMTGLEEDFDEGARLMEAMRIYESSGIAAFLHEKDHEEEV